MGYEEFLELVKTRRSIRRFSDQNVSDESICKILDASRYAMSGGNSQPWEFIVIRKKETIHRIQHEYVTHDFVWTYWLEQMRREEFRHKAFDFEESQMCAHQQLVSQQFQAPVLICVMYDPRKQFASVLSARSDMNDGCRSVLSCTMGHLSMLIQLSCVTLGLGSCRIDCNQQEGYRKILKYPEPVQLYCMVPVGYPDQSGNGHASKVPLSQIIQYEEYDSSHYDSGRKVLEHIRLMHERR